MLYIDLLVVSRWHASTYSEPLMQPNGDTLQTLCSISMHFAPDTVEHAVALLASVNGIIRAKRGCLSCTVSQDVADAGWIYYMESWDVPSAFDQHVHSEAFHRVLVAMDLCSEEPHVVFGTLSGKAGIACLQELRDPQHPAVNGRDA